MQINTSIHAASHELQYDAVPVDQALGGHPYTGAAALGEFGGHEIGVWEMTPGVMRDVEADEIFVVLSGAATVEFDDGTPALSIGPGDVVRLAQGARTTWSVTATLRKVYLA